MTMTFIFNLSHVATELCIQLNSLYLAKDILMTNLYGTYFAFFSVSYILEAQ